MTEKPTVRVPYGYKLIINDGKKDRTYLADDETYIIRVATSEYRLVYNYQLYDDCKIVADRSNAKPRTPKEMFYHLSRQGVENRLIQSIWRDGFMKVRVINSYSKDEVLSKLEEAVIDDKLKGLEIGIQMYDSNILGLYIPLKKLDYVPLSKLKSFVMLATRVRGNREAIDNIVKRVKAYKNDYYDNPFTPEEKEL